jgi:Ca2+-binding RTX toxin-like protein
MTQFFGTAGADSITEAGSVGFGGASLSGIGTDNVFGNGGDDTIAAGPINQTAIIVFGGDGNDSIVGTQSTIFGAGGGSVLKGDGGNDTIIAATSGFNQMLDGGAGNDSILGGSSFDIIFSGGGNDTIVAGDGGDQISAAFQFGNASMSGDGGNDIITGGFGNDTILGGAEFDTLDAGDGNNSISGGADSDRISAGFGNDTIAGDAGDDTISAGSAFFDSITSILGGNVLSGNDGNDVIDATNGNDSIAGDAGNDSINAGDGNNTVFGGADSDRIYAGFGNDSIVSGNPGDSIIGNDVVDAGSGNNTVVGGYGNDLLIAQGGNDSFDGQFGNDRVEAGDGANTILGGAGGDNIFAGFGNDSIVGGNAGDSLDGSDNIYAGSGNNTVFGGSGNDNIFTAFGADSIDGGDGNDNVEAGGGNDTVIAGIGNDFVMGGGSSDSLLGGDGNDTLDGGDSSDTLNGGNGNDRILAGGSGDTILASRGNDTIDGGDGTDLMDYSALGANARVVATLAAGWMRVTKRDAVTGEVLGTDSVSNALESFLGTANADKFVGWDQDETFWGGAGNDTINGGAGTDTARYDLAGVGSVKVNLLTGVAEDGFGGVDKLVMGTGVGNNAIDNVTTGDAADTIVGDTDANFLRGRLGADLYDGGDGFDYADFNGDYATSIPGVIANLSSVAVGSVAAGTAVNGLAEADTLVSIEGLRGTDGADTLIGDDANGNFLRGARGADLLDGNIGNDFADYRNDTDLNGDYFGAIVNLSDTIVTVTSFGAETGISVGAQRGRDGWGDIDTLQDIESATGTSVNDLLVGAQRVASFSLGGIAHYATDRSFMRGRQGGDTIQAVSLDDGVTASFSDEQNGIIARLDLGNTIEDGFGNVDVLVNVANVDGSGYDDLIHAAASGSWMRGRAGDDTMVGGAGFDIANYGAAAAGVVADLVLGIAQDGDGGTDSLGGSIDALTGSRFADTLIGDADGTWFFGGAGADSMVGGAGQDWLNYYGGFQGISVPVHQGVRVDLLAGQAQDGDTTPGGGSLDLFTGMENVLGSHEADTLQGNGGANILGGAEGNDSLDGRSGNDVLAGGKGADALDGGTDSDTASYETSALGVNVQLTIVGAQAGAGEQAGDVLSNIENLTGSAFADTLGGDVNANLLSGGDGGDSLNGFGGADTLVGGAGADSLNGAGALDTASYLGAAGPVAVSLAIAGAQTGAGDQAGDILTAIENLAGSDFADTLGGSSDTTANVLSGFGGDDQLTGRAGADTLDGGSGNDTAVYTGSVAGVRVSLAVAGAQVGGDAAGDILLSIENVVGSGVADTISGDGNANVLSGGTGADTMVGGAGNDTLIGGGGADSMNGGGGTGDAASYAAASVGVTVNLGLLTAQVSAGEASGDVLSTIENLIGSAFADTLNGDANANNIAGGALGDRIAGGGGADQLLGEAGADSIVGGAGGDTLTGGAGADTLTGGDTLSADYFVFNDPTEGGTGGDRITDFLKGQDKIVLLGSAFGGLAPGALTAANYRASGDGSAADADDYILYNTTTKTLLFDADGNGAGAALTLAVIAFPTGGTTPAVTDFIIA